MLLTTFLVFKKFQSRKISRQQKLKEMVVGNFLNIFALSAIIILLTILTVGVFDHFRSAQWKKNILTQSMFRTIDINSGISDIDGRENAIKSLVFQTCLETILQLYSFIANPALRLYPT